jgi:hypothetical protein
VNAHSRRSVSSEGTSGGSPLLGRVPAYYGGGKLMLAWSTVTASAVAP